MNSPVSLNATFRNLALAQGPMGPSKWVLHPFSGQTGGNPAYGHKHDHLVTPEWARAVVQTYASRPAYYDFSMYRQGGYYVGCRPAGMDPLESTDTAVQPSGAQLVGTVSVSGPDMEHFPLSPLFALADSKGIVVPTANVAQRAEVIARILLRYLLAAHAGMFRDPVTNGPISYTCSDRAAHYVLANTVQGVKRGLMAPEDIALMAAYIEQRLLPKWEAPLAASDAKGSASQTYNGRPNWVLPAIYDAYQIAPAGPLRDRMGKVIIGMSMQCLSLEAAMPGVAMGATHVADWNNLTPETVQVTDYYAPWAYRAWCVAAVALDSKLLGDAAFKTYLAYKDKKGLDSRQWLVDSEGNQKP